MDNQDKKQVWVITDVKLNEKYDGGWVSIGAERLETSEIEVYWKPSYGLSTINEAIRFSLEICELLNSKND